MTDVQYGDRRISYASLDDLLRAYAWLARQLGIDTTECPHRRVACVAKGLSGPGATTCGREHAESGVPGHAPDLDWEQR